jgi:Uma2 family endonuclease
MQATAFPAHARPRRLRRAEYDKLAGEGFFRGERVELIQGIVVEMSPVGPAHANPLDLLVEQLVPLLVGRARVRVQQPFIVADDSEPEPDLAIVPLGQYAERHPDRAHLIVEVAETPLEYDRDTKAPLYAAAGVEQYWIVDVNARRIEVYEGVSSRRYTRVRHVEVGGELAVPGFEGVKVRVGELLGT